MKITKYIIMLMVAAGVGAPSLPGLAKPWSEAELLKVARQSSLTAARSDVAAASLSLQAAQAAEKYRSDFFANTGYGETDRKQANQFQPVMTPTSNFNIGLRRQFNRGISSELSVFGDQMSTKDGAIDRAATIGTKLSLRADLLKNFLGRLDQLTFQGLNLNAEKLAIEKHLAEKRYEAQVRIIYWSMAANRQSRKISESLNSLATRQLQEAEKRQKLSVAEKSEIARYLSQKSQAETNLLLLDYDFQKMLRNLRALVPELGDPEFTVAMGDYQAASAAVIECTELIKSQKNIPWEYTRVDEVLDLAKRYLDTELVKIRSHDGANLNLLTELEYTGVDKGFADSASRFADDGRFGYKIGLEFSMPIGERATATTEAKANLQQRQLAVEEFQLKNNLLARHQQMGQLIALLSAANKRQLESSQNLETVARDSEKKYDQARVTVDQIIRDQNTLQAGLLEGVRTRLTVMIELLEYFAEFTETPCQLNRI